MKKLFLSIILVLLFSTFSFAKTIIIDIGHTVEKPGVISARGNPEIIFNYLTGIIISKKLANKGFEVYLSANMELSDRVKKIKKYNPDMVISIHHDSVQPHHLSTWKFEGKEYYYSDKFSGFSIFVSKKNDQFKNSLRFANLLGRFMTEAGLYSTYHHTEPVKGENRELLNKEYGVYRFDDLVLLKSTYPAVLLECGIIVNRSDELTLRSDYIVNIISDAVLKAVTTYFNHSL
jgi:N-acetylmuramoyl-L-alanine amidase